ncbi:hypothetical protein [Deinococcus sedimenti]|uniref:Uncharacterized protein n=1 Tax=Deinococcus sedimenti TaxID=1867090 RepID=A0ABQ2S360_9DEIO|nr:hypothetical protein [Deinococcus sedimenti]GGR84726.1 hypothetical protein GCM10008960_09690 [Deinococcus sedimenti]
MSGNHPEMSGSRLLLAMLFIGGSLSEERYDLLSELPDDVLDAFEPLIRNSVDPNNWVTMLGEFAVGVGIRDPDAYLYSPIQPEIDRLTVGWVRRACRLGDR